MKSVLYLSQYLPFELQFQGGGDIWTLYSVGADGDIVLKNGLHTQVVHASNVGDEYKPILSPIANMPISEIIIDGDKYSPCEILSQYDNAFSRERFDDEVLAHKLKHGAFSANLTSRLFEWHFDVFGLIGEGLAVNYFSIYRC